MKTKTSKKVRLKPRHGNVTAGCPCGLESVVPEALPWYLCLVTVAVRVYYVLQPRNWWLLHPDEIFQSVEVAHSEVYGNGFRTYEYSPPIINISTPVEEQEHGQGMYSLRSFLYPYLFASVFSVCRWMGVTTNGFLIGRITQSVVTSFTPIAVYRFCSTIFTCRGVASLASFLSAFSLHLSVLGTHTLVNSFISPFLFLVLEYILRHITGHFTCSDSIGQTGTRDSYASSNGISFAKKTMPEDGNYDINSNNKLESCNNQEVKNTSLKSDSCGSAETKTKDVKSSKSKRAKKKTRDMADYVDVTVLLICGYISAIVCYMRPDTLLFLAEIGMAFLIVYRDNVSLDKFKYLSVIVGTGFITGLLTGGVFDKYNYGVFFISPVQWSRLNAASHIPAVLYGSHSPHQYLIDVFAASTTELYFHIGCAAAFVYISTNVRVSDQKNQKSSSSLLLTLVLTLLVYSTVDHKEIRFLHNILIIVIILAAYSVHGFLQCFNCYMLFSKRKLTTLLVLIGTLCASNTYLNFPSYQKQIILPWNTVTPSDSSDINQCLNFISTRDDVTGLFLDASIYMTAAYSILHWNVPLITLVHYEYHEYRPGAYRPRNDLLYRTPENLSVINRYSDIIDIFNTHYLSKRLLERFEYNYIIIPSKKDKSFDRLGYNKVIFSTGGFCVVQRTVSDIERVRLTNTGKTMPLGNNATILEYEASWLYTAGLYDRVIERLESALELNVTRIRPYQLLSASYASKNDMQSAKLTEDKCMAKFGKTPCRTPQSKVVLHADYGKYNV